jgi:hypothetical protein
MLFQIDPYTMGLIIAISTIFVINLIGLLVGTYFMRWYARKKDWGGSLKTAFVINLIWVVIDLSLGTYFLFAVGDSLLVDAIRIIINIILGTILVMVLYKRKLGESLILVIVVSIILFLLGFVLGLLFGVILAFIAILSIFA